MSSFSTAQRVTPINLFDPVNYYRHLFAYQYASREVNGIVIEIGCGEGYGINLLIDQCDHYVAVDKKRSLSLQAKKNFDYFKMVLPNLKNVPSNLFDFAVSFQVIEHIKNDKLFLKEIYRVLKPGGKLLLTTPNRLRSVSRNPWHVREYIKQELLDLSSEVFDKVELSGIYATDRAEIYFEENKKKVENLKRYDVLQLNQRLPGWLLRIPYDMANTMLKKKTTLKGSSITDKDFFLSEVTDNCLDLFLKAFKQKNVIR